MAIHIIHKLFNHNIAIGLCGSPCNAGVDAFDDIRDADCLICLHVERKARSQRTNPQGPPPVPTAKPLVWEAAEFIWKLRGENK